MYDFYDPINQKHFITLFEHPEDNFKVVTEWLNGNTKIGNPYLSVKRLNHQESFDIVDYMSVVSIAILLEAFDCENFVQPLLEKSRNILASTARKRDQN